jgi:two-component system aerobic respiration control sensor histidine kinase ArcB
MNRIRALAQYYVDFMVKLGIIRFSLLLALVLSLLAMSIMFIVTLLLEGRIESADVNRSLLFALLITPCAVYFLSIIVEQLEASRQELSSMVQTLEKLHIRDIELHTQLQSNIEQLHLEMDERVKAEEQRQKAMMELQNEINSRCKAQTELEQQSYLLRSFIDASPDLVFYRNDDFQFSGCNRAMELLTGKGEKQLIGLTPRDVYEADVAQKDIETDEKVFQHHVSITYELWIAYPDGHKACFEVRKVPFYDKIGNRQGLMGFGRDITEHKRYQEALEKASRDKTTFISTISHELRTPLNGIVGLSRILLDMQLTAEQEKYLKTIHVSAIALGNIFNDIIELDKIERKKVQLHLQPVNLIGFLADLENIAGLLTEPKKLSFSFIQKGSIPEQIMADDTRLRQILWNLIGNAVKFTQKGSVNVSVWYENDKLYFSIQDTGIGISKEEQEKIFAMYYQVKQDSYSIPGTGIGLAVSQRLARTMGGDITVESEPGSGSCFTVSIKAPVIAGELLEEEQEEDLPILHILLVEDIELNVVVACSVLEKLGHTVDVAMTGKQALELFTPNEYDLVLLDIQLPDMTGFDIARTIHQRFAKRDLPPLVALTANVLKDKQEYLQAGMDDVLSKPLSIVDLTSVIKRFWADREESEREHSTAESGGDVQTVTLSEYELLLDTPMLTQYIELVDSQLIVDSLKMFEKLMPGYIEILDANMIARDEKGITEEAHKIKGAAGSVGLKHIQQLAKQIQTPTLPAWHDNVQDWVDELKQEWRNNVQVLYRWVKEMAQNGR